MLKYVCTVTLCTVFICAIEIAGLCCAEATEVKCALLHIAGCQIKQMKSCMERAI